jgi:hypothetical protein
MSSSLLVAVERGDSGCCQSTAAGLVWGDMRCYLAMCSSSLNLKLNPGSLAGPP